MFDTVTSCSDIHGISSSFCGAFLPLDAGLGIADSFLSRGIRVEAILGAVHPVFTKSSLVQIAGRADRKGPYTNSQVYFFYEEKTAAIRKACQEIKEMNEEGKKML